MHVWQIQNWGWISCGDQIEGKKTSLVPSFLPVVLFSSWLLILVPSYGTKLESSTPQLWNKTRLQYPPICLTLKEPELLFRNLFSRFWSPVLVFQQKLNSRIQPWYQFHHKGGQVQVQVTKTEPKSLTLETGEAANTGVWTCDHLGNYSMSLNALAYIGWKVKTVDGCLSSTCVGCHPFTPHHPCRRRLKNARGD